MKRAGYGLTYDHAGWRVVPVTTVVAAADGFKPYAGLLGRWRAKRRAAALNRRLP